MSDNPVSLEHMTAMLAKDAEFMESMRARLDAEKASLSEAAIRRRLYEECKRHGLNEWCRRHDCNPGYVSKVISGEKAVGPSVCRALGVERVVMYRDLQK